MTVAEQFGNSDPAAHHVGKDADAGACTNPQPE